MCMIYRIEPTTHNTQVCRSISDPNYQIPIINLIISFFLEMDETHFHHIQIIRFLAKNNWDAKLICSK